jgi:hypothetical protein
VRKQFQEREEVPVVAIVGGFDIHRKQITVDYADAVTGQVRRGRIEPACLVRLRDWHEQRFAGHSAPCWDSRSIRGKAGADIAMSR